MEAFTLRSFSKAILHVDGDSFFVSCEVARNPALKGKPVVTGRERGIASALSYELKRMGAKRAMKLSEIKKICPDVIILPSDYETYSLYSKRMYDIVRRYTPDVEEYSIDECFADITGLRRMHHLSYEGIAEKIKKELQTELGMTFSVGLAPTKVLAKVASKWRKPDGLTIIPGNKIHHYLAKYEVGRVWGIGSQTTAHLYKLFGKAQVSATPRAAGDTATSGVTALDFALKPEAWVTENFTKPIQEIWHELRGTAIYPLTLTEKHDYQSISKTKTFTPASRDRAFVFSQLSKNVENACIKARRHNLVTRDIAIFLKTQDFSYRGFEFRLSKPVSIPQEILTAVAENFDKVFKPGYLYRATGITLCNLTENSHSQLDLFGTSARVEKIEKIYEAIDGLSERFGKHVVFLGTSFKAMTIPSHEGDRRVAATRSTDLFKGETKRRRIGIPMLGEAK